MDDILRRIVGIGIKVSMPSVASLENMATGQTVVGKPLRFTSICVHSQKLDFGTFTG